MKRSIDSLRIRCARCGGARLLPLTVHSPRAEYVQMRRFAHPVRAELKCIACGHRHIAHPRVLLHG